MSPLLLLLLPLLSLSGATHNYDRSDARGVYYYNSYGQKRYSRCYERYALTSNDCLRGSSYRNYDYRDSYDRYNRYDRYGDTGRYDDKVNIGRGTFRIINGGRDAELSCEFPAGSHIISNIIWERGDRARSYNRYNYRDNSLGYLDSRMRVRSIGDFGSVLTIRNFDERADAGVYHCVATRTYGNTYTYNRNGRETVYMDIDFYPRDRYNSGSGYYSGRDYDGYFSNYDRYYNRPYYAYSKTAGDTLVTDNSLADTDQGDDNN